MVFRFCPCFVLLVGSVILHPPHSRLMRSGKQPFLYGVSVSGRWLVSVLHEEDRALPTRLPDTPDRLLVHVHTRVQDTGYSASLAGPAHTYTHYCIHTLTRVVCSIGSSRSRLLRFLPHSISSVVVIKHVRKS